MPDRLNDDADLAALVPLLKALRRNSRFAVQQFVTALSVNIPTALVINPPLKTGEPIEVSCVSGMEMRPGKPFGGPQGR